MKFSRTYGDVRLNDYNNVLERNKSLCEELLKVNIKCNSLLSYKYQTRAILEFALKTQHTSEINMELAVEQFYEL